MHMHIRRWLLLALCALGSGALAQNPSRAPSKSSPASVALGSPIPMDPHVRVGGLPNGLRYYIRQNKKPEHRAELRLVVNAGSVLESDTQLGMAHFIEHMAFNGTTHFKRNELINYLQSIGVKF